MIVRDCAKLLKRCIASMDGLYDYLAIVDTGTVNDNTIEIAKGLAHFFGVYTSKWGMPFLDDFAAARNYAMSLLPDDVEWLIWADSDDVFRYTANLRSDILNIKPEFNFFGTSYQLSPNSAIKKIRGSRNGKMKWYKKIHEYLAYDDGRPLNDGFMLDHSIAHGRSNKLGRERAGRNYTLLYDCVSKHPEDPHYVFLLAREYYANGRIGKAKEVLLNAKREILDTQWYKDYFPDYNKYIELIA